jgi:hypothetical protein
VSRPKGNPDLKVKAEIHIPQLSHFKFGCIGGAIRSPGNMIGEILEVVGAL